MARSHALTLLDLIQVVHECAANDQETLATVASLINSGKVRLCADFAEATIDVAPVRGAGPSGRGSGAAA